MSARNAPKRIPLSNDDREIIRLGVYRCCGQKWKAQFYQVLKNGKKTYVLKRRDKSHKPNVCRNCRQTAHPAAFRDWKKRWYGHFKCMGNVSGKRCGRTWTSSLTWTLNNKIQTTKCKACNSETMPYQLVSTFV